MAGWWVCQSCSNTYELEADATPAGGQSLLEFRNGAVSGVTPFTMVGGCDYGSEGCVFESRRVHGSGSMS